MNKIYISPDMPPSFRQTVKHLTQFQNVDIICDSEKIGHSNELIEVLGRITKLRPTLIITHNQELVNILSSLFLDIKIILFMNCQGFTCDRIFLSNAFDIEAFINSKNIIFKIT